MTQVCSSYVLESSNITVDSCQVSFRHKRLVERLNRAIPVGRWHVKRQLLSKIASDTMTLARFEPTRDSRCGVSPVMEAITSTSVRRALNRVFIQRWRIIWIGLAESSDSWESIRMHNLFDTSIKKHSIYVCLTTCISSASTAL